MRYRHIVFFSVFASLLLAPVAFAAEQCCDGKDCCKQVAACCKDQDAVAMLPGAVLMTTSIEPQTEVSRQVAVVWFMRPVWVGEFVLQGQYIIEHDTERMAKGLPCTHIYAANRPQVPVVKFHCTHLERGNVERDTVVLQSTGDTTIPSRLAAFQFAGESAAHGVPGVR